jgi:hypothetical protein
MWNMDTPWFDVALIMAIFAFGNILFGHFQEHMPKWRRVLKAVLLTGLIGLLSAFGLRWVAYTIMGALGVVALYVHAWWLPRNGVNGWTGEPKSTYYELIKVPRPGGHR